MAYLDIGIDLGTTTVVAMDSGGQTKVSEPALVAVDRRRDEIIGIGSEVYKMVGRTPDYIQVINPVQDGVISDFKMTQVLIRHVLQIICHNQVIKPRVIVCVPSAITPVESQAVIDAAVAAGARSVYLIEEPVAAAVGAGIDLSKPCGNMLVDIGGGTTDIAVVSLNGIVCKSSLRTAGKRFDEIIIRHMRNQYNLLVGDRIAEQIKIEIGSVDLEAEEKYADIKGRDLLTGLPRKIRVGRREFLPQFKEIADLIVRAVQGVLEKTPPELAGDIYTHGLILTGGGALIHGMDKLISSSTRVKAHVAENAMHCVADGTAKSFELLGALYDGFVRSVSHTH